MKKLVKVKNNELVVSSRDVAVNFDKEHNDLKKKIRELQKDMGEISRNYFIVTNYIDVMNRKQEEYLLTRDGFTLLAMGFTGKKALEWKLKYIAAFNEMERTIKESSTYQNQIDSKFMYQLAQEMELKEKQIQEMKPKALFADAVATSTTSILIGELAKLISQNGCEIGQNRLFKWLRTNNYLIKRVGESYNTPTQYSMELGLMETKVRTITNPDGSIRTTRTTKVTGKGQVYFINKFLDENRVKELA